MQQDFNAQKSINVIQHINKIKDNKPKSISVNAKKAFDKIEHPLMSKALKKLKRERKYLNIMTKAKL
jgi:hypothetical protein